MIDYKIEVLGEPIAKARPLFVHKDRNGKALPYVKVVNKQEDAEAAYKWEVIQYLNRSGTGVFIIEDCPIAMGLTFIMPIRKNWPQYKIRDLKRGMVFYHFKKSDLDNLVKFVKDCLEGICYKNDSQIAVLDPPAMKIYGLQAKTIIRIRSLPEFEILETGVKSDP